MLQFAHPLPRNKMMSIGQGHDEDEINLTSNNIGLLLDYRELVVNSRMPNKCKWFLFP